MLLVFCWAWVKSIADVIQRNLCYHSLGVNKKHTSKIVGNDTHEMMRIPMKLRGFLWYQWKNLTLFYLIIMIPIFMMNIPGFSYVRFLPSVGIEVSMRPFFCGYFWVRIAIWWWPNEGTYVLVLASPRNFLLANRRGFKWKSNHWSQTVTIFLFNMTRRFLFSQCHGFAVLSPISLAWPNGWLFSQLPISFELSWLWEVKTFFSYSKQ